MIDPHKQLELEQLKEQDSPIRSATHPLVRAELLVGVLFLAIGVYVAYYALTHWSLLGAFVSVAIVYFGLSIIDRTVCWLSKSHTCRQCRSFEVSYAEGESHSLLGGVFSRE